MLPTQARYSRCQLTWVLPEFSILALPACSMVASSKHTGELAGRAKLPGLPGHCGGGGWAHSPPSRRMWQAQPRRWLLGPIYTSSRRGQLSWSEPELKTLQSSQGRSGAEHRLQGALAGPVSHKDEAKSGQKV